MKKRVLHILALLMVVAVAFSFAGCNRNGFDASLYVKGILDVTYKDDSTDYLKMVDDTADNAHEMYLSGLDTEAEYFASVYSIETLSDETRQAIVSMYQEIYQHSNYEVKSANVTDSGYTVEVLIRPIDIFIKTADSVEAYIDEFNERNMAGEFADMTDEEFEDEYAKGLLEICNDYIPNIGYMDEQSIVVKVTLDESSHLWTLSDQDFSNIDELIIDYNF